MSVIVAKAEKIS